MLPIVHMGDFGQSDFNEEQAEFARRANVLMIPIGVEHTIGAQKTHAIMQNLIFQDLTPLAPFSR